MSIKVTKFDTAVLIEPDDVVTLEPLPAPLEPLMQHMMSELSEDITLEIMGVSKAQVWFRRAGIRFYQWAERFEY